jgi:apolipoprotein N-acyltransferase
MLPFVLLATTVNPFWYALPAIVAVSLVYAATRHEDLEAIVRHAVRVGGWIVGFLVVVSLILWLMSRQV